MVHKYSWIIGDHYKWYRSILLTWMNVHDILLNETLRLHILCTYIMIFSHKVVYIELYVCVCASLERKWKRVYPNVSSGYILVMQIRGIFAFPAILQGECILFKLTIKLVMYQSIYQACCWTQMVIFYLEIFNMYSQIKFLCSSVLWLFCWFC